jgi:NAD-dependent SIR2 family protein deacetylase
MKQKELKNLAKKIAKFELIIQNSDDMAERAKAEAAIMELSGKVNSLEDIVIIDELVQEYIEELS